ncbi:MAG: zf-HC2 domain-containing protein [Calditrichaeota bacterium]|nr:MAG: zf-HC2 domain-containing protein [Calditrichota bacterium]
MNCRHYRKLLLFKAEELTARERTLLQRHLAACSRCREQYRELDLHQQWLDKIKREQVVHPPDNLTDEIIRSIRRNGRQSINGKHSLVITDRIFEFFARGSVRLAFAAVVFVLAALFAAQEWIVLQRIQHLEKSLQAQNISPSWSALVEQRVESMSAFAGDQQQIVIDREMLQSLLAAHDKLQMENKLLLEIIVKQAEKAHIQWEDGLTEGELKKLLTDKNVQLPLTEL